jgi:hypothetical protein
MIMKYFLKNVISHAPKNAPTKIELKRLFSVAK